MISVQVLPDADPKERIQEQIVYLGKTSKGVEKCHKERKAAHERCTLNVATILND